MESDGDNFTIGTSLLNDDNNMCDQDSSQNSHLMLRIKFPIRNIYRSSGSEPAKFMY